MCRLHNKALRDYQESVTIGQMDRQTPHKVIPMCRYALHATQQETAEDGMARLRSKFQNLNTNVNQM